MPNRVLRDGLVYSGAVNKVSVEAECLFVRIMLAADDFGLLEIDPTFLKARCLPAREFPVKAIAALVDDLCDAGLLRPYEVAGKRYAAIEKWDQRRFAKKSKYPIPPWGTEHVRGGYVDPRISTESHRAPTVGKKATGYEKRKVSTDTPPGFDAFWSAYPKKIAKPAAMRAWRQAKIQNGEFERVMAALKVQADSADWHKEAGRYIPHPATWLNGRRWDDEPGEPAALQPGQYRPDGSFKVAI